VTELHAPIAPRRAARSGRRSRAGLAAAALLLATAPAVTGCGAGFTADSLAVRPNAGAGISGSLRINNVWVVVDPATGQAQVIGAVANTGNTPDGVTGARAAGVPAQVAGTVVGTTLACARTVVSAGTVIIPPSRSVSFGRPGCPQLSLLIGAPFRPGRVASVTLLFARAAALTVNAQIVTDTGLFTDYRPISVVVLRPSIAPPRATVGAAPAPTATAIAEPSPGISATKAAKHSPSPNAPSSPAPTS
jgi:hypothetical protein